MPAKKRRSGSRAGPGARERAPSTTIRGRFEIPLEEMRSQNRATIEAVQAQGSELRHEIQTLREELTTRIDTLATAVRDNSEHLRRHDQEFRNVGEDLRAQRQELGHVREELREQRQELQRHGALLQEHGELLHQHSELLHQHSEQLQGLTGQGERIERKLDSKADAARVDALESRVEHLERKAG